MSEFIRTKYMGAKMQYKNRVLQSRFKYFGIPVTKMNQHNDIRIEESDNYLWARTKDDCLIKRKGIRSNFMGDVTEAGPVEVIYICKHPDQYVRAALELLKEMYPDVDFSKQDKLMLEARKDCAEKFTEDYASMMYDTPLTVIHSWQDYRRVISGNAEEVGQLDLFI